MTYLKFLLNIMFFRAIVCCLLLCWNTHSEASPIDMKMVDMTYVFDSKTLKPPKHHGFQLLVQQNNTVEGKHWLQLEDYYSGIHVGTHIDAPCHIIKGATCVDKIPMDRMIAPAAVVDITKQAEEDRDYLVQIRDLQNWEEETGDSLDGKIVLIRSGWGSRWLDKEAFTGTADDDKSKLHSPGMSAEASQWLVQYRNTYGLGTETLSLDHGPTKDDIAHQNILGANLYGLECVANMDKLPINGAMLYVFPMKIGNGSGAPVRIIATFPAYMSPDEPCDE